MDPARPAWPARAGPRAMGAVPAPWERDETSRPLGRPEEDERAAAGGEVFRRDRVVPRYVDDLAGPRQPREVADGGRSSGPDEAAAGDSAPAETAARPGGQGSGSAWNAWSSAGSTRSEDQPTAGGRAPGREPARGPAGDGGADAPGDEQARAETPERAAARDAAPDDAGAATTTEAGTGEAVAGESQADEAQAGKVEPGEAAAETGADAGNAGPDDGAEADADQSPMGGAVTVVPGVPRYHRRGCILIRFLGDDDLETMTRREAEAAGLVPCKACQPDKRDPPG